MNRVLLSIFTILRSFWQYKKNLYLAIRLRVSVYAILLTCLSFSLHNKSASFRLVFLTALAFALSSASIQVFNDFIDRECDEKKGKTFALNHKNLILSFLQIINVIGIIVIILLSLESVKLAIICSFTWILGIAYSLLQKIFLLQNIIVAVCGSIPALSGWIFFGKPEFRAIIVSLILFFLNIVREILKDIQDRATDPGYKVTLPIVTANKIMRAEEIVKIFRRRYHSKDLSALELLFLNFNTSTFPSIDICCYIVGYIIFPCCFCLGYPGFIVSILIVAVVFHILFFVSINPDKYVLKTKYMINATMFILIFLMFFV